MSTATVTSKGQVTIPVAVRAELGLHPGSRLRFTAVGDGRYEIRADTTSITDLKGSVPSPARPVSLEEMDEAISSGSADVP